MKFSIWEARVVGMGCDVSYGACAEYGYTVIVQKSRKVTGDESLICGRFKCGETGKVVLTFFNQSSKKKKEELFSFLVNHDHFPFIFCVERYLYYGQFDKWESCFDELSLDPKPVKDCYSSGLGYQLNLQYADLTNSLQPPKKYVPWV